MASLITRRLLSLKTGTGFMQRICRNFSSSVQSVGTQVTQQAPDFKGTAVINKEFKEISLSDFSGRYLVLFFYPLDFTFVCPTEITAFSDRAKDFHDMNTSVVAVSTDSHFSHLAWINTPRNKGGLGEVDIPVLSDFCKTISRDYGVLLEDKGIALRGLFIIDEKGTVRHTSVNDLAVGRSVDETLRLVQAYQFTDKHGEVCPATWKPGGKSIKPSAASAYFESVH